MAMFPTHIQRIIAQICFPIAKMAMPADGTVAGEAGQGLVSGDQRSNIDKDQQGQGVVGQFRIS